MSVPTHKQCEAEGLGMAVLICKLYFQQQETNHKSLRDSYYGLGCEIMYFGRYTPMFCRNVLLLTSRWNWATWESGQVGIRMRKGN